MLDKDSYERFSRLKAKIPAFDEDEILAAALKCLEQKVDRIIMKQRAKMNRGLKDTGQQPKIIGHYPEQRPPRKSATFQIK
ncbi:MAG: hypothetical protein MUO68_13835, partial [Desulfobacteraceae bacterium]|nr:hypothetical protein [Desulfobacteraceae bacterium]